MQYRAKVVSLTKLIVGQQNFMMPLCNSCSSKDCENPIENRSVAILGVTEKIKVWNSRSSTGIVISCEGYNP